VGDALIALGGAFLAAGLLARVGRRIGLPTIPFFILAGILTGPHTPGLVLMKRPEELELFAAVGLILLLFHLGLEFSLDDLMKGGRPLVTAGLSYIGLNVGGGLLFGLMLGWGTPEAFVIAGAVGISSSAIVTKLVVELKRLANPETKLILGIIVVEDVFLALYLAILQPILAGTDDLTQAFVVFGRGFAFLLTLALIARFGARWVGRLIHANDDELLTVLFVGLGITVAGLAEEIGVSDAIGAFMVGLIVAETTLKPRVERLVLPLRDAFAAVFFFAFGLTIDPAAIGEVAAPVAAAVALSLVLNLVAGLVSARRFGFGREAAANVGLTILGRGEFSLILATLAAAAGLDSRLGAFIGLYVLALALLGPLLASRSKRLASLLPGGLFPQGEAERPVPPLPPSRSPVQTMPSAEGLADVTGERPWPVSARTRHWERTRSRLLVPVACFGAVVAYGVSGYVVLGHPLEDALVRSLAALFPAGGPSPAPADDPRWFALTITLFGLVSLFVAFGTVVAVGMEGGFGFSSRRRRVEQQVKRLEDHYIVCAYGRVGRAAAGELEAEGVPFVVIEAREDLEPRMGAEGVLYVGGDPTSEAVLRKAGVERAKGLVCAVDSDATNVYITLMARSLNPDIYIVARASEADSPQRLMRAGANRVISPYRSSGRQMAHLVLRPTVVDSLDLLGKRLEEVVVESGSELAGLTVGEACGAAVPLLIYCAGGETAVHPDLDEIVHVGDRILVWGEGDRLLKA
jgi:CPA2 family monovalent cation:H+ antiporter-2